MVAPVSFVVRVALPEGWGLMSLPMVRLAVPKELGLIVVPVSFVVRFVTIEWCVTFDSTDSV